MRIQAAEIVALIAKSYGSTYSTLLPRVTKTLAKALSVDVASGEAVKPLTTHFGAIVGLTMLGPLVVDSILLAMIEDYFKAFGELPSESEEDTERVLQAWRNAAEQWQEHFGGVEDSDKLNLLKQHQLL